MTAPAVIERAVSEAMAIRRADAADLDAVLALERAGFDPASRWSSDSWAAEFAGADRCVLVADAADSHGSRQARPADHRRLSVSEHAIPPRAGISDVGLGGVEIPGRARDDALRRLPSTEAGLAGVATFQLVGDTADLHRVVVAPDHRGRGIGRALVEAGIAWAAEQRGQRMLLEVEHDNAPALALYRRLGFAELARRKDYYGPGRHALVMQYEITELES